MLQLSFDSGEDSLSVRRFSVREAVSTPFEVTIEACSPSEDLDLDAIVGKKASFRVRGAGIDLAGAPRGGRLFRGVCSRIELIRAEPGGLSTYSLRIVPALWLLTQRRNYRVFQHTSAPEIVQAILSEWGIEAALRVDPAQHPKLEYRVQYGESDLDLVSRLLEDAGIALLFPGGEGDPPVLLADDLRGGEELAGGPIAFIDDPSAAARQDFMTDVRLSHEVRPGKATIRDFDFRRSPRYELIASAAAGAARHEEHFEQYHYLPGSFLVETGAPQETPIADGVGAARHEERTGKRRAERLLEAEQAARRVLSFKTSVDVWPGAIFSMSGHPRADLGPGRRLLVTETSFEGTHDGEWTRRGKAALIGPEEPYRPLVRTLRPRIHSVQSAVVVGPSGEDIHTDELGRVRVQFHWDREGQFDERSSCWVRVSQGWAGGAFGMMALPRVGQEVLVSFLEGDPDQPIVVGRVFNNTTRVPYKLPEQKTVSTWKSDSSPGSGGFNEILFDDAAGSERVYMQAERNLEKLVKVDESDTIGGNLTKFVRLNETETTGVNRTIAVGANRTATIGAVDAAIVGDRHAVTMVQAPGVQGIAATGIDMVDRKITLSTGEATITLEGPNITLAAAAGILLEAASTITVHAATHIHVAAGASVTIEAKGGDVLIQGGPMVRINPEAGDAEQDDDNDEDEDEDEDDDNEDDDSDDDDDDDDD